MGEIRVGTASWTDETLLASGWYPPEVRHHPERRLRYYAQHFDAVEVDSTFYALPRLEVAAKWAERTPAGFLFHVKAFSAFTGHGLEAQALPQDLRALLPRREGHLPQREVPREVVEEAWRRFFAALKPLETLGKLGYLHFGLPPWTEPKPRSFAYLEGLAERTRGYLVAVEFRNPRWYAAWGFVRRELRRLGLAHVSVDAPPHPEAPPRVLESTHPVAVLRCHGRNAETWKGPHGKAYERFNWRYTEEELQDLAQAARTLAERAEAVYVTFNNNYGTQGVEAALGLKRLLGLGPPSWAAALP
ncbi:DUF72 domain-containing protein [Thermus thermamylovorans]|uniref:DUF72 domain-containing protein n=1 Tax=Thermus thermamylovorans TaxID=2509362 RepID=A0A4Q9B721_9DEIN|nr:DUF72 domain-containing protein [Thermus thermamylovorans]TBH21837.1 DUF72 domain-containing protein [Thermus thermamylovorans]